MATLNDVYQDKPIEFMPYYTEGSHSKPVCDESVFLNEVESQRFCDSLASADQKLLVEETLQGLCQRNDGTLLKSAFPSLTEFKMAVKTISVPKKLLDAVRSWESMGCNEILIHFEERLTQA